MIRNATIKEELNSFESDIIVEPYTTVTLV
jgi:hypothetical protein